MRLGPSVRPAISSGILVLVASLAGGSGAASGPTARPTLAERLGRERLRRLLRDSHQTFVTWKETR